MGDIKTIGWLVAIIAARGLAIFIILDLIFGWGLTANALGFLDGTLQRLGINCSTIWANIQLVAVTVINTIIRGINAMIWYILGDPCIPRSP